MTTTRKRQSKSHPLRFCTRCGNNYRTYSTICPFCGSVSWAPYLPTKAEINQAKDRINATRKYAVQAHDE